MGLLGARVPGWPQRGWISSLDTRKAPDMNDPFGLIFALLITGLGASWIFYPQWAYRVVSPGQATRDRKRFKTLGFVLLPVGLVLLALRLLK